MMRLVFADSVSWFEFGAQFSLRCVPSVPKEMQRREKYFDEIPAWARLLRLETRYAVPEILHSNVGIRSASSESGLGSGEIPRHEHDCNFGINVTFPTGHPCFMGPSNIAQARHRLPVNPGSPANEAWSNPAAMNLR